MHHKLRSSSSLNNYCIVSTVIIMSITIVVAFLIIVITVEVRLSGTQLTGKFDQPDLILKKITGDHPPFYQYFSVYFFLTIYFCSFIPSWIKDENHLPKGVNFEEITAWIIGEDDSRRI